MPTGHIFGWEKKTPPPKNTKQNKTRHIPTFCGRLLQLRHFPPKKTSRNTRPFPGAFWCNVSNCSYSLIQPWNIRKCRGAASPSEVLLLPGDDRWPWVFFDPLFGGHKNHLKGHVLNHPKKVTKNCQMFFFSVASSLPYLVLRSPWKKQPHLKMYLLLRNGDVPLQCLVFHSFSMFFAEFFVQYEFVPVKVWWWKLMNLQAFCWWKCHS